MQNAKLSARAIFGALIFLSVCNSHVAAQSRDVYLQAHRYNVRTDTLPPVRERFKILGFGAYHGAAKTEVAELCLLSPLVKAHKISYYLPETDYSLAHYFNRYLQSGDTVLLRELVSEYGRRVPQERSEECYAKWKQLREIFCGRHITVVGVDCIVSPKFTARHLSELLGRHIADYPAFKRLAALDNAPTDSLWRALDACRKEYKSRQKEMLASVADTFAFVHILKNIRYIDELDAGTKHRDEVMCDNYTALMPRCDFRNKAQFVRMGFGHLEEASEEVGSAGPFFALLLERHIYLPQEVVSVIGYLTDSRVLWNASGQSKGDWGIGDSWREYFEGIKALKRNRISDCTLYKLNAADSPYRTPSKRPDLIRVRTWFEKNNKAGTRGKATTDFVDYALLISNSPANRPLQ